MYINHTTCNQHMKLCDRGVFIQLIQNTYSKQDMVDELQVPMSRHYGARAVIHQWSDAETIYLKHFYIVWQVNRFAKLISRRINILRLIKVCRLSGTHKMK